MLIVAAVFGGLAIVIGLFFAIVHPFVCIVECALAKEHSGTKKAIWIVLSLLLGAVGSLIYALFVTRSSKLKRFSMQGFSVGVLCLAVSSGIAFTNPELSEQFAGDLEDLNGEQLMDALEQQLNESAASLTQQEVPATSEEHEAHESWTELASDTPAFDAGDDLQAQLQQHMQASQAEPPTAEPSTLGAFMDGVRGVFESTDAPANAVAQSAVDQSQPSPTTPTPASETPRTVSTSAPANPPQPTATVSQPIKRNRYRETRYAPEQRPTTWQPQPSGTTVVNRYTGR